MVSKTLFLVLLGSALVLAAPKVSNDVVVVDEAEERSIEDAWRKLEYKFSQAIEKIRDTWHDVKQKGQNVVNINLKVIREKGIELIHKAKEVYREIKLEGKKAAPEIDNINKSLKDLADQLKHISSEAVVDAKQLVHEVVDTVREQFNKLKKHI